MSENWAKNKLPLNLNITNENVAGKEATSHDDNFININ